MGEDFGRGNLSCGLIQGLRSSLYDSMPSFFVISKKLRSSESEVCISAGTKEVCST